MSAEAAVLAGRREAESLMVDACTIVRLGTPQMDENTGLFVTPEYPVYEGKCKVQSKDSSTSSPESGEAVFVIVSRQVHIPAGAADVVNGDVVTVTASTLNPFGVGRKYRVEGFSPDTYDTAARLPVKEVT